MLFISPGTCRWPTVCQALSFGDAWCHRGGSRGLVSHSPVSCWAMLGDAGGKLVSGSGRWVLSPFSSLGALVL